MPSKGNDCDSEVVTVPYATGRHYHDADSHLMEPADWLIEHADPAWRDRMPRLEIGGPIGAAPGVDWVALAARHHADPVYRADESQVLLRKNYLAVGSYEREHRTQALDQLGFASQLVFNTFTSGVLAAAEQGDDVDLAYAMADAHNRGMVHFCELDPRLLPVTYVCLMDRERAVTQARSAIELGGKALMIASACPRTHSPSHVALDGVWACAADAGVPVVMHVGGGGRLVSPAYFENGLPPVPDFHGGAENFRSIDYLAIPYPPMQTLGTLLLDGVFDRFPTLRFGVIEQGASWVPGWMRFLDSAFVAFRKHEERLQRLSAPPSELVRRQVRVTPYPHEDVGWIVHEAGSEICLFSSDYPHVEGGRNPIKRFEESLSGCTEDERYRFYTANFEDLMGPALAGSLTAAPA